MSNIQLYNGDCLEVMKQIPDNSVDMILTDPPYGTTACKWDSVIPFEPMWKQLNRIIKPNGAIVLFGSEPFSSALRMSNIKNYKYDWIWEKNKTSNFLNAKYQPMKMHEVISVFGLSSTTYTKNGKNMKYVPQGLIELEIPIFIKGSRGKDGRVVKDTFHSNANKDSVRKLSNYPKSILKFNSINSSRLHPTQKPVTLLEYLIKTYTLENEIVLDFTMGSGSTGVACVNTNRKFIGIELDENYFNISKERIEQAQNE